MNDIKTTDDIPVNYIQKMHRWRMAFFGVIILLAGIIIGGASMMIIMPDRLIRPPAGPEFESLRMIPPLRRDLGLTQEQAKKIQPILDNYMQKLRNIRENARTEVEQTLEQMNTEISSVLTEQQKQKWTEEVERLQRQIRPGRRRMGERMEGPRRGGERGGFRWEGQGQPMRQRMRRGMGPNEPVRVLTEPNSVKDKTSVESTDVNDTTE
jgi:hypothetical protein